MKKKFFVSCVGGVILCAQLVSQGFAGQHTAKEEKILSISMDTSKNESLDEVSRKAEQGDALAQYNLGLMYDRGEGVPQDKKKAAGWYAKAARYGLADAQLSLGLCYANGEGVEQNKMEAYKWWLKAAEQGDIDAQENLNILCADSPEVCKR